MSPILFAKYLTKLVPKIECHLKEEKISLNS